MTDAPIHLDARRTATERHETEMRRRPANNPQPLMPFARLHLGSFEDQIAGPARTWVEVMEKWRFLLERYAATPDAGDERIQKLIKRAIGDMERLRKREERKC